MIHKLDIWVTNCVLHESRTKYMYQDTSDVDMCVSGSWWVSGYADTRNTRVANNVFYDYMTHKLDIRVTTRYMTHELCIIWVTK